MGYKIYDTSGKSSVLENLKNGEAKKVIEVFFENGDEVKTRVASLAVGSNDKYKQYKSAKCFEHFARASQFSNHIC